MRQLEHSLCQINQKQPKQIPNESKRVIIVKKEEEAAREGKKRRLQYVPVGKINRMQMKIKQI